MKFNIQLDLSRDNLLTAFSKTTLKSRYLYKDERFQDLFARVACHYADNKAHAQRLYDYMSKLWFLPATPILSNGGTDRGLPVSCFLNEVEDSLTGIADTWNENVWLASKGGGIGTYWGNVRSIGESVGHNGKTTGIMPFISVSDRLTLAISQGSLRRGSAAVYIPVSHPEIEEFIDIRRPTGGDPNRKALNLHHGVVISDTFMRAVLENKEWELRNEGFGKVVEKVAARDLWIRILLARVETGEPYILFSGNVNNALPETYRKLGLGVVTSNLCSEITLTTGKDHLGNDRTAVCCLSSLNLLHFDSWKDDENFIPDVVRFLDNVLQDFIDNAPEAHSKAKYSAYRERSIGLGVMGFHSFLQSKMVPFESVMSKVWNKKIFQHISSQVKESSSKLAAEKGPNPDALECGLNIRNTHIMAIAPTATISIIAGSTSPGIEPWVACVHNHKTLEGSFLVKNNHLKRLLESKAKDTAEVWSSIMNNGGSVQHFSFLNAHEKEVFKTAFEIDQKYLIDLAADRAPYICQAQSLNLFLPSDVHKIELHQLHVRGWIKGIKSFYYLRSKSLQRAESIANIKDVDECLSCQ